MYCITEIEFKCPDKADTFTKQVSEIANLNDFLLNEPLKNLLPGITSIQEALDIYHQFWTDEYIINSGGMVAIDLI